MTTLLPFRWHIAELFFIVTLGLVHRHLVASTRERRLALLALIALLAVTMWPMGDLASSVSLTAATLQRLIIMLLVAPLLLMATPTSVLSRLTQPRSIDAVTRWLAHPGVAVVVVTVLGTGTLITPVVDGGAHSSIGRDLILLTVLLLGIVLWLPALGVLPGAKRLSPVGRAGYVFGSALVVTSLSLVWIFSRHSLYPGLHGQYAILHMTPLFDQQLAGFVAKFGSYLPMGAVAFTIFARADEQGAPVEETPLHWADVERQLLRIDRQRERELRRHHVE